MTKRGCAAIGIAASCALAIGLVGPAPAAADASPSCDVTPRTSLVVNVKDMGAKGDGKTNDTNAIRRAIQKVAGTGGMVYVPKGVYLVDTVKKRLSLGSDMTFKLADGAVLKAIPTGSQRYSVLMVQGISQVNITGGTLLGDRKEHKGKGGEWGMGIRIAGDARHITIAGVSATHMWGDGFYVSGASDIRFCGVNADQNRRQGLSIISATNVLVRDSIFQNTHGTAPASGIDLEPDKRSTGIANIRIENNQFIDNQGDGLMVSGKRAEIRNVKIIRNTFKGSRPILVENAPKLRQNDICYNRFITYQKQDAAGMNAYAEPVQRIVSQSGCENSGIEIHRVTKKK
ncbi:glycosyl hydrolase family 28-related protein [Methyloligella sp. 2.7D]|uniref:glycosyl hydrolase family 28-related protein n=1 Tax=unclassified Methyloligella TaxID=2625955 RepID=UPI00157CB507|nr:glycosyl hydrolase family 28-related protein [Methyloligella sp. GL2]QKP78413.1 right-handed parallel beta-helix repeat-containing protein [Methyloligella sp. GL2]